MAKSSEDGLSRILIGGLATAVVSRRQLAEVMVDDCLRARNDPDAAPKLVFSSNGQGVALSGSDPSFRAAMEAADIIHADGFSVYAASWITEKPLPERVATTDFFHDAARAAQESGLSFFILGGSEAQNARAVGAVRAMYPKLRIVGRRNGYFSDDDLDEVIDEINQAKPDVLWVGLGKPRQEFWCVQNKDRLAGVGWIKTCGGLYAFLSGDAPRAPEWMQGAGLEWLYRTMKEPRRLFARYAITNVQASYRLLRHTKRRASPQ